MEVYKCLQKTLRDIRYRSHERRIIDETKKKKDKKIVFTLQKNINQTFKFEPEFRI